MGVSDKFSIFPYRKEFVAFSMENVSSKHYSSNLFLETCFPRRHRVGIKNISTMRIHYFNEDH